MELWYDGDRGDRHGWRRAMTDMPAVVLLSGGVGLDDSARDRPGSRGYVPYALSFRYGSGTASNWKQRGG